MALDGVRLLGPDTIELIFQEQAHGTDLVLGVPLRWGIGYGLPEAETLRGWGLAVADSASEP